MKQWPSHPSLGSSWVTRQSFIQDEQNSEYPQAGRWKPTCHLKNLQTIEVKHQMAAVSLSSPDVDGWQASWVTLEYNCLT